MRTQTATAFSAGLSRCGAETALGAVRAQKALCHGVVGIACALRIVEEALFPSCVFWAFRTIVFVAAHDALAALNVGVSHDAPVWEPRVTKRVPVSSLTADTGRDNLSKR